MNATDSSSSSSPPVTPPTKSLGEDVRTLVRSSLPSPPPSSSSRHVRAYDQPPGLDKDQSLHPDQDQDQDQDRNGSGIDKIARRLSPPAAAVTRPRSSSASHASAGSTSAGAVNKTHSSSSSLSSSASNSNLPMTLTNKHVALAKTKTLGHLTRSTSSEVDNEVANALASGRIIMSKTDWKEEDAQFLVQLIETQFPKGNIIWDWVGQQMTSRGFTKNQCRSKWKRIRTKVLHGGEQPPSRDKDSRDHFKDQEPDELIEEEEDELADQQEYTQEQRQEPRRWNHRPDQRPEATTTVDAAVYRKERHYSPAQPYDRHHNDGGYYYDAPIEHRDDHRFRSSPVAPPMSSSSYRSSAPYQLSRQTLDRVSIEEDELLSDDDLDSRHDRTMAMQRDYSDREHSHSSRPHQQHYRQQSSSTMMHEDFAEESSRPIPAIAATPITFGKIEWKPEDSDYLVRLIESKFASRKVDWAWVSKQMEGRGYDRTQCKSRWWRVQHRQNQSGQHPAQPSHHGSTSQLSARGRQRQSLDPSAGEYDPIVGGSRHKSVMSDVEGGEAMGDDQRSSRQGSIADRENTRGQSQSPSLMDSSTSRPHKGPGFAKSREARDDDDGHGGVEDRASSPRATRGHEHQKHIEWKEEDSQYMYRMIEKEFPVGNVVWSVIGERMASRGYSQTQCMSKWRRHLKNNKLSHDGTKGASMDMDMDMDMDLDGSLSGTHSEKTPRSFGSRQRAEEEQIHSEDRDDVSKRYKTDGGESRRYEKDIDYRSAPSLDAQLVEQEYDRYYDAGGKRKRARNQGSLSQADYLRQDRGAISSHDDRYEVWRSRDPIEGSERYADRPRDRGLSKDTALNRDYGDSGSIEPEYGAQRHQGLGHSREYSREQADTAMEEQDDHPQRVRDPYYSKSTSGRHGSSQYSRHGDTSLNAEARHRPVEHDGTHSAGRKRMPRVDEEENRLKERPPVDWDRRRQDERYDDSYDRHHHRRSRPSMDYGNDYGRSLESGYSHGSHPHPHDRHHSRRATVEEERLADLIDPALEDDMDWAFGRYESRDMARLAAAVARQGRRWDAIRAQIRMPILVSPYDDREDELYEGKRFDPHPAVGYYQQEDSYRSGQSHHRTASSTNVSYYNRPSLSTASKHTARPSTTHSYGVVASNYRKAFAPVAHARRSREAPAESSEAMQVDLTIDAPEDGVMGSKDDPVIDVESIDEEEIHLGHDDASKHAELSMDKDLDSRRDDVGPEEAEMDPVESRATMETMDEDDAEAGSSEQQVKALDVQVEEVAV
ncbi:hypothetical protein BGZ70_009364 [Mortierella alpina]|uniref:Myb-like domain-containing protein n=1 Tax=Mortierella alpina TaxID=64518 RepID=A0A9P6J1M3_MORAP|nr:hypothetical protein BGZ70_009364 [Mortierella alpina]